MNNHPDIPEQLFNKIESYLLHEMPQQERADFEQQVSANETLAQSVESLRLLLLGVQEASLVADMQHFHSQLAMQPVQAPVKAIAWRKWLVAAAAVVAIGAFALFMLGKPTEERLFSSYYKPDPGLLTAMGASDNYAFDKAMIDYKSGDYASALKAWQSLLPANPANDTLNYFIGTSYLALGNSNKATLYLQKVCGMPNSYFQQDACWYLGLALLKEGRDEEAAGWIKKSTHRRKESLLQELAR